MPSGVTAAASSQASLREEPIEWTPSTKNKDAELPPIPVDLPKWLKKMLGYLEDWMKIFVRKGPPAVEDVDTNKYVGRWYNVRYDYFTLLFNSPNCATAYYNVTNETASSVSLFVNNSGLDYDGKTAIYLTGEAVNAGPPAGDLTLQLEGVGRAATYRIAKLGPPTYGAGYYAYSVVTDPDGLSLYVLARDVDEYFATYDDEVKDWLKKHGWEGFIWESSKNNQDGCPPSIYDNAWDPSLPPGGKQDSGAIGDVPLTPGGNQDGGVIGDVKPVPPVRVPLPHPSIIHHPPFLPVS
mmetsp:Transcript_22570/g.70753  ORF Transcript_22570/g.70753 Transcript_22570/m.70753 type:complete len:295 (-) Transcript_22570:24-908(-)